jgi:hypothetical protein
MNRLQHLLTLLREGAEFAAANKAWWLVPMLFILLGVAAIISFSSGASPLIYTLF